MISPSDENLGAGVQKLDYGHATYPAGDGDDDKPLMPLPASVVLILIQIPSYFCAAFVFLIVREGRAKSLFIDSSVFGCIALPSIVAVGFAVRECCSLHARNAKRALFFRTLVLVCAVALLSFIVWGWYSEVWLDRIGSWMPL